MALVTELSRNMHRGLGRIIATGAALSLLVSAVAPAFARQSTDPSDLRVWQDYGKSENPGPYPVKTGIQAKIKNPGYDLVGRGGVWTKSKLWDWQQKRHHGKNAWNNVYATMQTSAGMSSLQSAGDYPWEGSDGGTNTATGNHMTEVPIVGWSSIGQLKVGFGLVYNTADASDASGNGSNECSLADGWRTTYDWHLVEVSGSTTYLDAAVTMGDGTTMLFPNTGSGYNRPVGFFDTLVKNSDGTWTLTRTNQWTYKFSTAGWLSSIKDRFGNALTIGRDSNNRITSVQDNGSGGSARTLSISWPTTSPWNATITAPNGKVWTLSMSDDPTSTNATLTKVTYPSVGGTSYHRDFTYDSVYRLTQDSDRRGKVTTYNYAGTYGGAVSKITSPEGRVTEYWYNAKRDATTETGTTSIVEKGTSTTSTDWAITEHKYGSGTLSVEEDSVQDSSGNYYYEQISSRNTDNQPLTRVDRNGKTWTYTYSADSGGNNLGDIATITDPLGHVKQYSYNSTHDLTSFTNGNGKTWTYDYYDGIVSGGPLGALRRVQDPLYSVSGNSRYGKYAASFTYDSLGNPSTISIPGPGSSTYTTSLSVDSHGDVYQVTNPDSTYSTFSYGTGTSYDLNLGKPISSTAPDFVTTTYTYDELQRTTSVQTNSDTPRYYAYDGEDHVTQYTDSLSTTSTPRYESWTYTDDGRLASHTNNNGETESYSYDNLGYIQTVTNARGFSRTYTNSMRGDVTQLTMPESNTGTTVTSWSTEKWSYDGNGNTVAYTNGIPQTVQYTFDNAGRMTKIHYTSGTDTVFSYDAADRRTQMTDSTGSTTWGYDDANQNTSLSTSQSGFPTVTSSLSYVYRADGQRDTMTESSAAGTGPTTTGGTTTYGYDSYGRPTSVQNVNGQTTAWTYDSYGRISLQTYSASHTETFGYDDHGRQSEVTVKNPSGTSMEWQKMQYDTEGNMTWRKHGTSSSSFLETDYTYDLANQILTETRGTSGTTSYFKGEYAYDANGNRLSKKVTKGTSAAVTTSFGYDAGDKLIQYGSYTIPYDAAGRPTKWPMTPPSGGYGLVDCNWDYESRLTQLLKPTPFWAAKYNGLDSRVYASSTATSSDIYTLRDGAGVTSPVISQTSGAKYGPTWTNITPGISAKTGSTTTYQHAGIKNNDAQSTSSTAISATRDYDAWGNVIASTGTFKAPFSYGGKFGYQEDADSGLKLLGHRYYDPNAGRFLTRDGAKDSRNWYSYCRNNPMNRVDCGGLRDKGIIKGSASGVLLTPGYTDGDGQFVVGNVTLKNGREFVDERVVHLDFPHGKAGYRSSKPHINSDMFTSIDHAEIPAGALKYGSTRVVKGLGKALLAVAVVADVRDIYHSENKGSEAIKKLTVWGGAWVGAEIGTMICPGIGTVLGGIIGGVITGLIVGD